MPCGVVGFKNTAKYWTTIRKTVEHDGPRKRPFDLVPFFSCKPFPSHVMPLPTAVVAQTKGWMRFPALGIHDSRVFSPPSTEFRRTPRFAMERWTPPSLAPAWAVASFSGKTGLSVATSHSKYGARRRRPPMSRRGKMTVAERLPHNERENETGRIVTS